ncbi:MAG: GTPase [Planctomycetota bacterium]
MLDDTVFALASAVGPAERAIVRLTGPEAFSVLGRCLEHAVPRERGVHPITVSAAAGSLSGFALAMPGPRSFTGEDCVELHVPGAPALTRLLTGRLANCARLATPGEFTRRAFENGRLGLDRAEALRCLIDSQSEEDADRALAVLHTGLGESVDELRQRLLAVRALVEASLDFEDEETGGVADHEWQPDLESILADLDRLSAQVPRISGGGDLLLVGEANAGKSSLCNALAGRDEVLATPIPGTTRDLVPVELEGGVRLLDAPGDLRSAVGVDDEALERRRDLSRSARAMIWVIDPEPYESGGRPSIPSEDLPLAAIVLTRADRVADPALRTRLTGESPGCPLFVVSSVRGDGIEALRDALPALSRGGDAGMGPAFESSGREVGATQALLGDSGTLLREALNGLESGEPPELLSARLGDVLGRLAEIEGRHSPEDLLDRIFGSFCLGK